MHNDAVDDMRTGSRDWPQNKQFFRAIYLTNAWHGTHSRSGQGSEGEFAVHKINILHTIINRYGIRSLLDIGCGDFYWMQNVAGDLMHYVGIDIVPELITANTQRYSGSNIRFSGIDVTDSNCDLSIIDKHWDLVTCLDIFGHLLNHEVDRVIAVLSDKVDMKYLLITNRRDAESVSYLHRPKTRHEGIDIEMHHLFPKDRWQKLESIPSLYQNDWLDFYACA